jgi:uncharacterized Ntn-hydrolase superfamily protein
MRSGRSAAGALGELVDRDEREALRQVAMIDAAGRVAVHTGHGCIPEAGHRVGDQMSAQANMMRRPTVPDAMVEAYSSMTGDLADRILAAFDAAEAEGGDIRGRQSAAIVIVGGKPTDTPWKERRIDLRVEDHPEPVQELRRLVTLRRAYDQMERGEDLAVSGDLPAAVEHYERAHAAAPDSIEISFWLGLSLAGSGRVEEGLPHLKRACLENDGWVELVRRMSDAGMIPAEAAQVANALAPQQ